MPAWGKVIATLMFIAGAVLLMGGPGMTHCAHAAMPGAAEAAPVLASHPSGPSEQDPCAGGAHVPAPPSESPQPGHCASGCGATCTVAGLSPTFLPAIHIAPSAIESLDDGDPDVTDREPATPPPRA
jgi:hypothetical protein